MATAEIAVAMIILVFLGRHARAPRYNQGYNCIVTFPKAVNASS